MGTPAEHADYDPTAEVTQICRDLIRIDTTNFGDQQGPGERKAAEHVATLLDEVGIESELWEAEPDQRVGPLGWGPGRPDPRARAPRRGPRRRRGLAAAPVQRVDPRGPALGAWCRGHEGLRRHAPLHGPCACPGRGGS